MMITTSSLGQSVTILNKGANIVIGSGTEMNVQGHVVAETEGKTTPSVKLDGKLMISGDLISYSPSLFNISTGYLVFTGNSDQFIGGIADSPMLLYKVSLRGTGTIFLERPVEILSDLNFGKGYLELFDSNLILRPEAMITGSYGAHSMLLTSGDGMVEKQMPQMQNFFIPLGTMGEEITYSPVDLTWTDGTFYNDSKIKAAVKPENHPQNASADNYLNRQWTVLSEGIDNPVSKLVFRYAQTDVSGKEERLSGMRFYESQGYLWPRFYEPVHPSEHFFALETNKFGEFTAGDLSTSSFSDVIVFPNPNDGNFFIKVIAPTSEQLDMRFTNMAGQLIYQGTITQGIHRYDFSASPRGIYFVKIFFENKIVTRKIVIQ